MSEDKGRITITNNFYGTVGQQIAHVDTLIAHFDKDMNMQVTYVENDNENDNGNEALIQRIKGSFMGVEDEARKFLTEIRGMKDKDITAKVKRMIEEKKISELSCHRDLWQPLFEAGLYSATETNWNRYV